MGAQQYAELIKQIARGMISVTGGLVVLLGITIWISAVSTPPKLENQTALVESAARMPSSIHPQLEITNPGAPLNTVPANLETVSLGCIEDGMKIQIQSETRRVRLKARLCADRDLSVDGSSLVNRANGFEATLFKTDKNGFSSDYIALSEGANQLLYQLQNESGQRFVGEINIQARSGK
jgi:hypothetical protein